MAPFPSSQWLDELIIKLNSDEQYARIAKNWEGDIVCSIDPDNFLENPIVYYLDLWHGKCRAGSILENASQKNSTLTLNAPYENYAKLLKGEFEPMQALLTRKLKVKGNMTILMRNVPTVLDFVRCCREITDTFL